MNYYGLGVAIVAFGSMFLAGILGLRYSQATLLFGLIAVISAPIVIHKVSEVRWVVAMLVGLSYFASFPLKLLFQIDAVVTGVMVTTAYFGLLFLIGFGWKRSWQ